MTHDFSFFFPLLFLGYFFFSNFVWDFLSSGLLSVEVAGLVEEVLRHSLALATVAAARDDGEIFFGKTTPKSTA